MHAGPGSFDDKRGQFEQLACGHGRDVVDLPDPGDLLERDCEVIVVDGDHDKRADLTFFPRVSGGAVTVEVPCPPKVRNGCDGVVSIRARRGSAVYGSGRVAMHENKRVRVVVPLSAAGRRAPVLRVSLKVRIGVEPAGYSGGFSIRGG
jgi:hypothetical protein